MLSTSAPALETVASIEPDITAVSARYRVLLLDLHSTFMFGGDRFGPGQDFAATYASLGAGTLGPAEIDRHIRAAHAFLNVRYADPRYEDDFPSVAAALHAVAPNLPAGERDRLARTFSLHECGTVPDDHAAALKALARTHELRLISNIWATPETYLVELARVGVLPLFERVVFSSEGSSMKPSRALFERALKDMPCAREEVLMIGDNLRCDMLGAKRAGLATLWLNGSRGAPDQASDPALLANVDHTSCSLLALVAPAEEKHPEPTCPNCESSRVRRYCPDCGQAAPRPDDYSLRSHAADVVDLVTSLDGRVARTFRTLLTQPGALTTEHLAGRRARYLRPLHVFLLVNVLLFFVAPTVPLFSYRFERYLMNRPPSPELVASLVRRAEADKRSEVARGRVLTPTERVEVHEAYVAAFDRRVETQRKTLIILFAPVIALVLALMFAFQPAQGVVPRRYGEHLVFALHTLAFVWLTFAASFGVASLARSSLGAASRLALFAIIVAFLVAAPVYLFRALTRVYRLRGAWAFAATIALSAAFVVTIVAYRGLLFFTTWLSL